ncbi:MAG: synthetase, partial [Thermomicrobiales bacterium]|nr:synthetase [Thermomicrobiales bacterium]
ATVAGGSIRSLTPKEKLPTYNVFYEGRTVSRGVAGVISEVRGVPFGDLVVLFDFGTIAPEVCEDLWSPEGPTRRRTYSGAELVCNVSASPFRLGVVQTRRELIATRAADYQCAFAYANLLGANDGLIFDGGGYLNQNGKWTLEAPRWREGFAAATVDLDRTSRLRAENTTWRVDAEAYLVDHAPVTTIDVPSAEFSTASSRASLTYPVPSHGSYFLPVWATTSRRTRCSAPSAWPSPAAGTRC